MDDLLRQKFASGFLKEKLLSTKGIKLVEGNTWGGVVFRRNAVNVHRRVRFPYSTFNESRNKKSFTELMYPRNMFER